MINHSQRSPKNSVRAWWHVPGCWATRARNSPDNGRSPRRASVHAIAILFARNAAERERVTREHQTFVAKYPASKCFHHWTSMASRPLNTRTIISVIVIGSLSHRSKEAEYSRSRLRRACQGGRIYFRTSGPERPGRSVAEARSSSRMAPSWRTRRLQEHVGAFRNFLRQHGGPTAEGQTHRSEVWDVGKAGLRSFWLPKRTIRRLALITNGTIISIMDRWTPGICRAPGRAHPPHESRDTAVNIQRRR